MVIYEHTAFAICLVLFSSGDMLNRTRKAAVEPNYDETHQLLMIRKIHKAAVRKHSRYVESILKNDFSIIVVAR